MNSNVAAGIDTDVVFFGLIQIKTRPPKSRRDNVVAADYKFAVSQAPTKGVVNIVRHTSFRKCKDPNLTT